MRLTDMFSAFPWADTRVFEKDRFVYANFISVHHSFIQRVLNSLDIEKIETGPILRVKRRDVFEEPVIPIYFGLGNAIYDFTNEHNKQAIKFYCNFEQLKKLQLEICDYCCSFQGRRGVVA